MQNIYTTSSANVHELLKASLLFDLKIQNQVLSRSLRRHNLLSLYATSAISYLVSSIRVLVRVVFFGQFAVGL